MKETKCSPDSPEPSREDSSQPASPETGSLQRHPSSGLPDYLTSVFWHNLIQRAGEGNYAVSNAIDALFNFHSDSNEANPVALQTYNKAIQTMKDFVAKESPDATVTTLMCCFIFVCIECLLNNHHAAIENGKGGLKVYKDWIDQGGPFNSSLTSDTPSNKDYIISRLGSELEDQIWLLTNGQFPLNVIRWEHGPYSLYYSCRELGSAEQAMISLDIITRRLYCLVNYKDLRPSSTPAIAKEHQLIGRFLCDFQFSFRRFTSTLNPCQDNPAVLLLEMRYYTMFIMHEYLLNSDRIEESNCLCERILEIGEKLLACTPSNPPNIKVEQESTSGIALRKPNSSLLFGLVPCLYFTFQISGLDEIRKKAIAILCAANRIEGIWSSQNAAKAAQEDYDAELRGDIRRPRLENMSLRQMLGIIRP